MVDSISGWSCGGKTHPGGFNLKMNKSRECPYLKRVISPDYPFDSGMKYEWIDELYWEYNCQRIINVRRFI
jgi:hypothetical protein